MSIWSRIANAFAARPRQGRERIITPQPLWQQFERIGGGLTPQDVSDILRNADCGQIYRLIDLGNESRQKDPHLQSVLNTREIAVSKLPIVVVEPESATAKEKEAAALIKSVVDTCIGGRNETVGLVPAIEHMQRGLYFGYSVLETDWRLIGGKLIPTGFWKVPHRSFAFDGADGRLKWAPSVYQTKDFVDLLEAYPARFIQHQPTVNGDVASREGLLRVLVWSALFRNWTMRDWLTLAELSWKPWRIGRGKAGASQEDLDNLDNILQSLTTTGSARLNDKQELEIEWPGNSTSSSGRSNHAELYAVCGEGMSKATLGQTLTTEAGVKGTQALGTVQNEVREDLKENDAMTNSATLMRDLWTPLVRFNFGNDCRVPVTYINASKGVDRLSFAQALKAMREAGMPRMDAKWARAEFGAPEPEDDAELMIPIPIAEPVSDDEGGEPKEDSKKKPPKKSA